MQFDERPRWWIIRSWEDDHEEDDIMCVLSTFDHAVDLAGMFPEGTVTAIRYYKGDFDGL